MGGASSKNSQAEYKSMKNEYTSEELIEAIKANIELYHHFIKLYHDGDVLVAIDKPLSLDKKTKTFDEKIKSFKNDVINPLYNHSLEGADPKKVINELLVPLFKISQTMVELLGGEDYIKRSLVLEDGYNVGDRSALRLNKIQVRLQEKFEVLGGEGLIAAYIAKHEEKKQAAAASSESSPSSDNSNGSKASNISSPPEADNVVKTQEKFSNPALEYSAVYSKLNEGFIGENSPAPSPTASPKTGKKVTHV